MASGQFAIVYRQIGRLFQSGSVAGLSEGQLLDRFVSRRDDAAFEAIVARHGPMVLGVCRTILRDPNDVEDAFQATFLVLVKKADVLARGDLLGNWLYGVAHRVARRARIEVVKRQSRESTGPEPADRSGHDLDAIDIRPMIHDEVNRLPASYRAAVVLCYLEGRTHEEAAQELGWPIGTVKGRLARAKEILRGRFTRRGLAVPSATLIATLARDGQAAVAPILLESTTSAAIAVAAAPFASLASHSLQALSPHAIVLTQGVLRTMSTTKLKLTATVLVAGMLSATGVSAYQNPNPNSGKPGTAVQSQSVAKNVPASDLSRAEARLRIAEEAIAAIKALPTPNSQLITSWTATVHAAKAQIEAIRIEQEGPIYYVNKAALQLQEARQYEAEMTERAKSGQTSDKILLLTAQIRRLDAEDELESQKKRLPTEGSPAPTPVSEPTEAKVASSAPASPSEPGTVGVASVSVPAHRNARKDHPDDRARNRKIETALEKVVAMRFPSETPLEDVLKYIKENTKDENGRAVPIYLDPKAEAKAEKTGVRSRPIAIDIDDLPLRTTLRLILKQASLEYRIRDGLLFISDSDHFQDEENPDSQQVPDGTSRVPVSARLGGFQ